MDELGRSDGVYTVLLFLVERYVMIDGKHYRDLPRERREAILKRVLKSAVPNEQEKSWALREILREHGAFRGVPFSVQSAAALDDFIAAGKPKMDKFMAASQKKAAEAAEIQKAREERALIQERQESLRMQRQKDAPYRFSADAVLSVLGPSLRSGLSQIIEGRKRVSPAFVAVELGISKKEAKEILNDAAESGEVRRTPTGWFEARDR